MNSDSHDQDLLGELIERLVQQHRNGQTVDLDRVCLDYPKLSSQVKELFSAAMMLENHKPQPVSSAQPPSAMRGEHCSLGGYDIVREIGRGGMGVVYEAIQCSLGRRVALKVISQHLTGNPNSIERFRREARFASVLHHSSIVPVFDVGEADGVCFYAMQFIAGKSLDQVIAELHLPSANFALGLTDSSRQPFGVPSSTTTAFRYSSELISNSAKIALQVAEALSYAHGRGILHRDVKPANILIDSIGNAWVTDFGLARLDDSTSPQNVLAPLTETGGITGTLRYMAPERLQGRNDHRADVYGLSATIYELITGQPTFDNVDRVHLMQLMVHQDPKPPSRINPSIPRDLETILLKGLSRDVESRYQTANDMANDLRLFLLGRPILARRTSWLERSARWCTRNPLAAILLGFLALSLLALLIGWSGNIVLQRQRDDALAMSKRVAQAELDSRVWASLNAVEAHRRTLSPELTSMRRQLSAWSNAELSSELRNALRNEIAACAFRTDWYRSEESIPCAYSSVAIDPLFRQWAVTDSENRISIGAFPPTSSPVFDQSLEFVPVDFRFSRTGKYLCLADGFLCQIIRSADHRRMFEAGTQAVGIDVHEEQSLAIVWTSDNRVVCYSLNSTPAKPVREFKLSSPALSCRICPDGLKFAIVTRDLLEVRSLQSDSPLASVPNQGNGVMDWSEDGQWLAVAQFNCCIEIRAMETLRLRSVIPKNGTFVSRLDWDSTSKKLAAQNWDGSCLVYDAWTGRALVQSKEQSLTLLFDRESRYAGWTVRDQRLFLLHWHDGLSQSLPLSSVSTDNTLPFIAVSEPLKLFASATRENLSCFDAVTGNIAVTLPVFRPVAFEFSSDHSSLIVLGKNAIQVWPIQTRSSQTEIVFGPPQITKIDSIDSGALFSESGVAVVTTPTDQLLEIDLESGKPRRSLGQTSFKAIRRLGRSSQFALHDWHLPVCEVWDLSSGSLRGQLHTGNQANLFADDRCLTISASNGLQFQFWDGKTLEPQVDRQQPSNLVAAQMAFAQLGSKKVLHSTAQYLSFMSTSTNDIYCQLPTDPADSIIALAFAGEDRYVIGLSPTACLLRRWDLGALNATLQSLQLHWDSNVLDEKNLPTNNRFFHACSESILNEPIPWIQLRLAEAREAWQRDPNSPSNNNNLAWCLLISNGSPESRSEALQLAQHAVTQDPSNFHFRNTLALALYRDGQIEEASKTILSGRASVDETSRCFDYAVMGLVEQAKGDTTTAKICCEMVDSFLARDIEIADSLRRELELLLSEIRLLMIPAK